MCSQHKYFLRPLQARLLTQISQKCSHKSHLGPLQSGLHWANVYFSHTSPTQDFGMPRIIPWAYLFYPHWQNVFLEGCPHESHFGSIAVLSFCRFNSYQLSTGFLWADHAFTCLYKYYVRPLQAKPHCANIHFIQIGYMRVFCQATAISSYRIQAEEYANFFTKIILLYKIHVIDRGLRPSNTQPRRQWIRPGCTPVFCLKFNRYCVTIKLKTGLSTTSNTSPNTNRTPPYILILQN